MRLSELDSLRGLAALSVALFHYTHLYAERIGHNSALPFEFSLGYLGVQLFFIISGFVIFLTLKRCKHHSDFLISRFSRIFPAYWFAILLTVIVTSLYSIPSLQREPYEIIINLTMLQGYLGVRHIDGVYWTLAYELLFYFFMYSIYRLKLLNQINIIIFIWLTVQLLSILIEQVYGWFPWKIKFFFVLGYINLFLAGIIFYQIYEGKKNIHLYMLLGYSLFIQWVMAQVTESIVVTTFFIIFLLFAKQKLKFISIKPLIFLGTISYPFYLIHQNIGFVFLSFLQKNNVSTAPSILAVILVMLTVASLITYYIEKPSMIYIRNKLQRQSKY